MTNPSDLVLTPQFRVPDGSTISARPCHLVSLKADKESKLPPRRFISLDKPDLTQVNCIQAKGVFSEQDEETIVANYKQIVQAADKESITEQYFPWHMVLGIRSLVFKAK